MVLYTYICRLTIIENLSEKIKWLLDALFAGNEHLNNKLDSVNRSSYCTSVQYTPEQIKQHMYIKNSWPYIGKNMSSKNQKFFFF